MSREQWEKSETIKKQKHLCLQSFFQTGSFYSRLRKWIQPRCKKYNPKDRKVNLTTHLKFTLPKENWINLPHKQVWYSMAIDSLYGFMVHFMNHFDFVHG